MAHNSPGGAGGTTVETDPDDDGIDIGILGSDRCRKPTGATVLDRSAWVAMENYAALVRERTAIRAGCLPLVQGSVDAIATRIAGLSDCVSAVFVVGLDPSDSACVQLKAASLRGPLVVSESDLVAAALSAAVITTLRRHGIARRSERVVVTNPETLPRLSRLLRSAGVAKLTTWNEPDSADLRALVAQHDVLVDLAGTAADTTAPGRTLRLPRDLFDYGGLVLPGLLSALRDHPVKSVTMDVLAACAQALTAVTPLDRILPALTEPLLVPTIGTEVARTLGQGSQTGRDSC
ncbi:hypothetical protein JOF57_002316 [Mycolicibacterium lutetiense]|uniref:Uncharacterized protein n=1 Tax=Mycolicibacterium lutetiense TaxID=1641992 RepID=A0ABS4ZSF3_9MYCO|nr:hypothetical protein [Mycolicibacterium lutetiense]